MSMRLRQLEGKSAKARIAAGVVAVMLGLGMSVVATQSASAATACTSLGRDGAAGNYLAGSCTGYPSFAIKWQCSKQDTVHVKYFNTSKVLPGMSFRFKACDRYVYSAWAA